MKRIVTVQFFGIPNGTSEEIKITETTYTCEAITEFNDAIDEAIDAKNQFLDLVKEVYSDITTAGYININDIMINIQTFSTMRIVVPTQKDKI